MTLSGFTETETAEDAVILDHRGGFGLNGEEAEAGDDFEQIQHEGTQEGLDYSHAVSHNDPSEVENENNQDDLASSGILILPPSRTTLHIPTPRVTASTPNDASLSPHLSLPDSECLPEDLQSLNLESVPSDVGSVKSENSWEAVVRQQDERRRKNTLCWVYSTFGGLVLFLIVFMLSTFWLLAERRSWVYSNQKLEDRMSQMQSDWVSLANKWQIDQEASLANSIKAEAALHAQIEEQHRKIQEMYEEHRKAREKMAERQKEQRRQAANDRKAPPFANKKSSWKSFADGDAFDEILINTEEAILKWSDATRHRIRNAMNLFGKKVSKVTDTLYDYAERSYSFAKAKVAKFWVDFSTAVHAPNEGWVEKAAPVVSGVLYVSLVAAIAEGTSELLKYLHEDQEKTVN